MLADRYELDHEMAHGTTGAVWLGRDVVLDRAVALKQIGLGHGADGVDVRRAEREAHLTARINHENVVAVFDFVEADDQMWLVMEHVDGPSLADLVAEKGPLDHDTLAPLVAQVAGALAAAHARGVVHRDVKPSNILLTRDGVAKLTDFGVARADADATATRVGVLGANPTYFSPEVARGDRATTASDVWSFGATIFHAVAGRPPLEVGRDVMAALHRIATEEPPRLDGDGDLVDLVTSMMQLDPADRPTMADVQRSTAGWLPDGATRDVEHTQVLTAPVTPPAAREPVDRTPWIAAAAAAAVIGVVAIGTTVGGAGPVEDDARAASAATPGTTPTASTPESSDSPGETTPTPEAGATPTAAALEGFAADYLTTASNNPDAGFAMLTPAYQAESNGITGYKDFWGKVSDLDVEGVAGNPSTLQVSYTYSYDFEGDRRSDDVTLQLEQSGDGYLIAGAV